LWPLYIWYYANIFQCHPFHLLHPYSHRLTDLWESNARNYCIYIWNINYQFYILYRCT
jgi:hypothetical protein